MAIAYLNPASATTNTNWDSSNVAELAQGEVSNAWQTTAQPADLILTLSDFDNTGVASIDSVRVVVVGVFGLRSGAWTAKTYIMDASGTSYYTESLSIPAGRSVSTVNGTVRTTSDGSSAWTDGNLDGMTLRVYSDDCAAVGIMLQFYIAVAYTEVTGYGNDVNGISAANIGKVNGVATANIEKINGV